MKKAKKLKPKGFGKFWRLTGFVEFDKLARALVQVPKSELGKKRKPKRKKK
ncbi:MAG TPA: hypothetical protein VIH42_04190 [Thermoguttaceae bacterium]